MDTSSRRPAYRLAPGNAELKSAPDDRRDDSRRGFVRVLVFPYAYDDPASRSKRPVVSPVARRVPSDLFAPVARVCARLSAVDRAAVPKAAVDESYDPFPCEGDVRATRERWQRPHVLTEAEPRAVENRPHRGFRPRVERSVPEHDRPHGRRRGRGSRERGGKAAHSSDATELSRTRRRHVADVHRNVHSLWLDQPIRA